MSIPRARPQPHLLNRLSQPQPHLLNRLQSAPRSQPQPQMCLLQYNYCECLGCDGQFANFQRSVEQKYMIPRPSLDKEKGIVTVIGTADATGVKKLLQKATGKKYFRILPTPNKETSTEAEKEANHPPPPPQQPPREDRSRNIHHVRESGTRMGQWCAPLNLFSRNKKQNTYIRLPTDD